MHFLSEIELQNCKLISDVNYAEAALLELQIAKDNKISEVSHQEAEVNSKHEAAVATLNRQKQR